MTGGPAGAGGFNVASMFGLLDTVNNETLIFAEQLTHSSPKVFTNDTVYWDFAYFAPDSLLTDTIYSVANSVNGDSIPNSLDKWNFGENFAVIIYDTPTKIKNEKIIPSEFVLKQNYPNPFNPTTIISFQIQSEGATTLVVYNTVGEEVATLVDEYKQPGQHTVKFDGSSLSSGIYFYQLRVNNTSTGSGQAFVETKKMVLTK
jgi:hypothetical protein